MLSNFILPFSLIFIFCSSIFAQNIADLSSTRIEKNGIELTAQIDSNLLVGYPNILTIHIRDISNNTIFVPILLNQEFQLNLSVFDDKDQIINKTRFGQMFLKIPTAFYSKMEGSLNPINSFIYYIELSRYFDLSCSGKYAVKFEMNVTKNEKTVNFPVKLLFEIKDKINTNELNGIYFSRGVDWKKKAKFGIVNIISLDLQNILMTNKNKYLFKDIVTNDFLNYYKDKDDICKNLNMIKDYINNVIGQLDINAINYENMDKKNICISCGRIFNRIDDKDKNEIYCPNCLYVDGKLRIREEIQKDIAVWFLKWQPEIDDKEAMRRADIYLSSMPAWANINK